MDIEQFDRWTRGLTARLTRRSVTWTGIGASALAILSLGAGDADARRKRKKKRKNKNKKKNENNSPPPPPLPQAPNHTCDALNAPCGENANCLCSLSASFERTCLDTTNPPDGNDFANRPCQQNSDCGADEACIAGADVCATICAN